MKKIISGVLAFILILLLILSYSIQPVAKFSDDNVTVSSPQDIIGRKIIGFVAGILIEKTKDLSFEFSEEDINDMLAWNINNFKYKNIKGIHCKIQDGKVILYIDIKFSSLISTQLVLKTNISIVGHNIKIALNEAHLGKIIIPRHWILKSIEDRYDYINVDVKKSVISIPFDLPEQIKIKDFRVTDSIKLKINVSIKSEQDLIDIINAFQ